MRNTDPIPAWAMKLIADAQIPNGRYVRFDKMTVAETLRWFVDATLRALMARALMQLIASGRIPLDVKSAGDKTPGHGKAIEQAFRRRDEESRSGR